MRVLRTDIRDYSGNNLAVWMFPRCVAGVADFCDICGARSNDKKCVEIYDNLIEYEPLEKGLQDGCTSLGGAIRQRWQQTG